MAGGVRKPKCANTKGSSDVSTRVRDQMDFCWKQSPSHFSEKPLLMDICTYIQTYTYIHIHTYIFKTGLDYTY